MPSTDMRFAPWRALRRRSRRAPKVRTASRAVLPSSGPHRPRSLGFAQWIDFLLALLRAAALALSHSRCASSARTAALASPGGFMKPAGPLPHRVVEPSLERLHPLLDALVHEQVPQRCFALARRAPRGRTSDRPRPCRRTRSGQPPGAGIHRPAASILDPTRAFAFTRSVSLATHGRPIPARLGTLITARSVESVT